MDIKSAYEKKYSHFAALPYYQHEYQFYGQQFDKLLSVLGDNNLHKKNLVDLGCGFGMKTHLMKQHFERVVGIDFVENIIAVNNLLSDDSNLSFIVSDLNKALDNEEKFDYLIANGLSLFNEKNLEVCTKHFQDLIEKFGKPQCTFIIWSFTDHSSTAPSGWYNHSKKEISTFLRSLSQNHSVSCKIFYPYKELDFRGKSLPSILLSIYRYFRKRQYYFIIIQYGI